MRPPNPLTGRWVDTVHDDGATESPGGRRVVYEQTLNGNEDFFSATTPAMMHLKMI